MKDEAVVPPVAHQKPAAKAKPAPEPVLPSVWESQPVPAAEEPVETIEAFHPQQEFPSDSPQQTEEILADKAEAELEAEITAPIAELEPAPPRVILPKKKPLPAAEPKVRVEKVMHAKQEVLQFESVTRGRFEKSEPTIVEGQDLDVPTFLRKNVRVK